MHCSLCLVLKKGTESSIKQLNSLCYCRVGPFPAQRAGLVGYVGASKRKITHYMANEPCCMQLKDASATARLIGVGSLTTLDYLIVSDS